MAFTPLSEVHLVQLELDIDNKNQLTFASATAQQTFFSGITNKLDYTGLTYVRKDGYIVVPTNVDNIYKYNYLFYKNTDTSTKWYYAFIVKAEYDSLNSTKVYIKTDVWQTYQFNIDFKKSFVEREMIAVADDIRGANLEPEDLEIGEPIREETFSLNGFGIAYVIAFAKDPYSLPNMPQPSPVYMHGTLVNNIASGLWYYIGNYADVLQMLQTINQPSVGLGNDVIAVFSIPTCAINGMGNKTLAQLDDPTTSFGEWIINATSFPAVEWDFPIEITSLNGYTPRNKKLLQYPFSYLGFTANNGTQKIFRYEDFQKVSGTQNARFQIISEINPNPIIHIIPYLYKGDNGYSIREEVQMSGYPNISYKTDYFNNWLAQNQTLLSIDYQRQDLNYDMSMAKTNIQEVGQLGSAMTNFAFGNIGGGISATEGAMTNAISALQQKGNYDLDIRTRQAQIEKQQLLPNSASMGGTNATLIGYGYQKYNIFARFCIKRQFAERIDEYFDMFGYKTNRLKIPNINNRPNWNYVKTLGCIIQSKQSTEQVDNTVLQEDMQELKSLFDNGITLWHNPSTFLDYSQSNR